MLKCVVFFFLLPFYPHFFSYTSYGTIRGLHWIFSTVSKQRVSGGSCVGQRRRSAGRAQWSHGHRSDAHGGRLGSRLLQRSPVPFALKTARDNEYGVSESYNTFVVFRLFCTFSSSSIFFCCQKNMCLHHEQLIFFLSNWGRLCCCKKWELKNYL